MSEQREKDAKIQDLPAKPVGREQAEAVKGGAAPINNGKSKLPLKPAEPVGS